MLELLQAFEEVLEGFDIIYILIDALDESKPRQRLLKLIRDLVADPRFHKVQLVASSREYLDIEETMSNVSVGISMDNSQVEDDIRSVVRSTLKDNKAFVHWPPDLIREIERVIPRRSHGMYENIRVNVASHFTNMVSGFVGLSVSLIDCEDSKLSGRFWRESLGTYQPRWTKLMTRSCI